MKYQAISKIKLVLPSDAQTSNPVQTRKIEIAHMGSTTYQLDKWNYQVFINIKKYKIEFKMRK